MNQAIPIILIPGMGADHRIFAKQIAAIDRIIVPKWIEPLQTESLAGYSKRWAKEIDPKIPCFIGGASFGGFVAMEMIKHLDVKGCFLIGSLRGADELPTRIKMLRKFSGAANVLPFELVTLLGKIGLLSSGSVINGNLKEKIQQLSDSDATFLRWASWAVLNWNSTIDTAGVPMYQIHGEKDFVLPVNNTTPDVIIKGARHIISISHPDAVTDFLKARIGLIL